MGLFTKEQGRPAAPNDAAEERIPPMKWKSADPETNAGFLSGLTFLWIQPLFSRAAHLRKQGRWLEQEDLPPVASVDRSEAVEKLFEDAYASYVPKGRKDGGGGEGGGAGGADGAAEGPEELERRLAHALIATCKGYIIAGGIFRLVNSLLQFSFPILLNLVLSYYQDVQSGVITKDDPPGVYYRGYWLSSLLMAFVGSKAFTESAYFHRMNRCSWRVKTAVSSSVYRKSLRLASAEQQKTTLGEIVNLMQVDAAKIEAFMVQLHTLWDGLFQIAGYMVILGNLLGWTCLVGLTIILLAIPVMGKITGRMFGLNRSMVKHTDERVKIVNEALQGMSCVKMYSWEGPLSTQIDGFRQEELASLKRIAYIRAFFRAYMTALPTLAAAATFVVYVYATDRAASASILFSSLVAFDMLRIPLMFYPLALSQYAQCKVSLRRVAVFLGYGEVNRKGYTRTIDSEGEVVVENATIYWTDPNQPLPRSELDNGSGLDGPEKPSSTRRRSSLFSRGSSNFPEVGTKLSDLATADKEQLVYPAPVLSDVNVRVAPGTLCAVVGPVGSGKSSLCSAILNEAVLGKNSHVTLGGRVAYASQTAWILNKTVRENILFGSPYDEDRYNRVIDACCLRHDLSLLEDGDMTEIGERGINLSGGQKQRVSIARAAYSDADVFIFDDPLSALDPEVAERVFDACMLGVLNGKTRILVTNQLQCLARCGSIIALGKEGRVLEQGTYDELINDSNGEVTRLLKGVTQSKKNLTKEEESPTEDRSSPKDRANPRKERKSLMTKEERETGTVKLNVYLQYISAGGGFLLFSCFFLLYILSTGTNVATSIWVSVWTADSDSNYTDHTETFYIVGYAFWSILMGATAFARSYGLASFGVRSSFQLHGTVLRSVFRAPMFFFDTTPTGRILSRFSKDMHTIDHEIADFLDLFVSIVLQLAVVMVSIVVITPYFAVALPFLGVLYVTAMNYFRQVSRETKRLESIARSPVYSQYSETLGGLQTIRAFGKGREFQRNFDSILDSNTQTIYCNKVADRWLACRLESIGAIVVGLAALFATQVVVSNGATIGATSSFASLAGISLSYAVTATGMMQFVVRAFAQVEAAMNSVERVVHYTEHIPQEAAMTSNELGLVKPSSPMNAAQIAVAAAGQALHPPKDWPEKGAITMKNLKMRYRSETPLVLKGLNVTINAGERIGVVGRTGSGKSSVLLALMRIVEPHLSEGALDKAYEAPLTIDGVDVMRIGLLDLRTKIGIIPQSPVLFSGTIRSNLDPFDNYSDEVIWSALEKCRMKDVVDKMMDGLQSRVAEYGENLSQGQRQLLCLGRALLKNCRILLLDEATSSVDFETDRAIQTTIREAFKDCTIITIAHRVNTILDSSKILVMDDGTVGEFDAPQELLKNKDSLFSQIVSHSNGSDD